jgi:hypothetical protein
MVRGGVPQVLLLFFFAGDLFFFEFSCHRRFCLAWSYATVLVSILSVISGFATSVAVFGSCRRWCFLHPNWNRCTYLAWFRSRCPRSSACEHEAPRDFREPICVSIVGVDRFFFRCRWVPLPISSISVLPAPRSQGAVPGLWFVCVVPRCRVCLF